MKGYRGLLIVVTIYTLALTGQGQSPDDRIRLRVVPTIEDGVISMELQRELEYFAAIQQRSPQGARGTAGPVVRLGGAWWTNTALVARLGLTDDQKTKIETTFQNYAQRLGTAAETLQREETQLSRLLEADPLDRNAVLSQIDRVVQARGELERANATMTLEMREHLTRTQWLQLQNEPAVNLTTQPAGGARGGGQRTGAPRGQQ
jgi:Spy/CpxP family protein refolding chaperone